MNILSLFPAVPLVMMLGLWLSKSTRQIHTVMVAGSSLLVALAVVLVVQYLGLRGAGETAQMLFTESRVWYARSTSTTPWASTAFRWQCSCCRPSSSSRARSPRGR